MRSLHFAQGTRRTNGAWARAGQAGLTIACFLVSAAGEAKALEPVAEARWYCPYTAEGDCTPYTRSFGYTPTRWRKWPAATDRGRNPPEEVRTPRPVKEKEELPQPEDLVPENAMPGPSLDDSDLAPTPPGEEPGLPSEMDNLFDNDTNPPSAKPAKPKEAPESDGTEGELFDKSMDSDTTDKNETGAPAPSGGASRNRHGARQTSYTAAANSAASADTKIVWRRSKRLGPADPQVSSTGGLRSGASGVVNPTRLAASGTNTQALPSSNPLRDAAGSASQLQAWAGSDAAPTTSFSTSAAAVRANPLRDSQ